MSQPVNNSSTDTTPVEDKALNTESIVDLLGADDEKEETLELGEPSKQQSSYDGLAWNITV